MDEKGSPVPKKAKTFDIEEDEKTYKIENRASKSFKGSVIKETTYNIKFDDKWQGQKVKNVHNELNDMFQDILDEGHKDFDQQDVARVYINHPKLNHAIIVKPQSLGDLSPATIMDAVQNVVQSEEGLCIDDEFTVQLGVVRMDKGAGRRYITNIQLDRVAKKSIVTIQNDDNLCLARSIAVGVARRRMEVNKDPATKMAYNVIRQGKRRQQKEKALEYHRKAQVPGDRPCTLFDIYQFENALDIQIVVFAAHLGNKVIYAGEYKPMRVYLYYQQNIEHFDTIVNIRGLLSVNYFCHKCLKGYSDKKNHTCFVTCRVCRSDNCIETASFVCNECNMSCRSTQCHERHLKYCKLFWRCPTCKAVLDLKKRKVEHHSCGEWLCSTCSKYHVGDHQCYLRIREPKQPIKRFIFFDFEARQDNGKHIANFVIAQSVCIDCEDQPLDKCNTCGSRCKRCDRWDNKMNEFADMPCAGCANREVQFEGDDTTNLFGRWLFSSQHQNCTVIAHNAKSYDNIFLLDYLVNNSVVPELIYNGSKIMYMSIPKLKMRVVDSLNFIPMKLSALPRAFGISQLSKGYFPHFFNTILNQTYVGPYPPPEMYGADSMSSNDREAFLHWYTQTEGQVFDFRQEMETYCRSDVDILRRACMQFRTLMLDTIQMDPFTNVTIASVCMAVYRYIFHEEQWVLKLPDSSYVSATKLKSVLQPNISGCTPVFQSSPIGKVPAGGYSGRDTYSQDSIRWLEWEAKKMGIHIQHALNGGEIKVTNGKGGYYKLDGCSNKIAFEYNGCAWHGCPSCYVDLEDTKHPYNGQSLAQRYALTIEKKVHLESLGYNVVTMWEHEFTRRQSQDKDFQEFVQNVPVESRLDPRDSFFGGRTNASKLYYKAQKEEKLKYVDFTSLYPTVNKYDRYPIGHPEIITSDFKSLDTYFGILKVTILPPRKLYHPVLPYRVNGKLMFPLCRTCVQAQSPTLCKCTDAKRMITGTWTSVEVLKAVEKGYVVQNVYEVYHFNETTQYNPSTGKGGLFSGYVNSFLKLKQEASGWPEWCKTDDDKASYITNYEAKEGIKLENVEKNAGLRSLAKLCLNSFWGKFGQRQNMRQTKVITDTAEFYKILTNPTRKLADWHILTEDMVQLEWEYANEFVPEDLTTNIFLATFTTAHARLRLYEVLDVLDKRVCYYDTDSIIYISMPEEYDPPLGDYLGDLTDELDGHYIIEFVSAGPKNYSYKLENGQCFCKVKGFTLNHTNSALINFNSMKSEVFLWCYGSDPSGIVIHNKRQICRDPKTQTLFNREQNKLYRVVYDKRVVLENKDTIPYGY